jgi:hypothetical protein
MKSFFYMGTNLENQSGVSWKIWQIGRKDRVVTVRWGPAKLVDRQCVFSGRYREQSWRLRTAALAKNAEQRRIAEKTSKGYQQPQGRMQVIWE